MADTLLKQIDDQLQLIQAKLRDGTGTGSDLGALVATLKTNLGTSATVADTLAAQVVTSDAVIDTLTTNVAVTKGVIDALNDSGNAGTGLGPKASLQGDPTDLNAWFAAAIVRETP